MWLLVWVVTSCREISAWRLCALTLCSTYPISTTSTDGIRFRVEPLQSCHCKPIQATFHVEFFFLRGESLYIRTDEAPPPGASSRPLSAPHLPIVSTNISDGRSWLWDGSWRFFNTSEARPCTETNRLIKKQSDWDNLTRKTPWEQQQQPQILHHI